MKTEQLDHIFLKLGVQKSDKTGHETTVEVNITVLKRYDPGVQLKRLLVKT